VGRELARRLGWDFVDLDARIEARERQTIPEIFCHRGEPAFRLAETSAMRDLLANSLHCDSVISLGGGAFVQETNRELLRPWLTVFLDAPLDELWRRCQQDGVERPLQKNREQFDELYRYRLPFYREATVTIETGGRELPSICSDIENALRLRDAPESLKTGESQ